MPRPDRRENDQLRPVKLERQYTKYAAGSVLITMGDTKVICTASVDESVPRFLKDQRKGWVTAEYAMLPAATNTRSNREVNKGKPSGRTSEIQRLIGRSLRAVTDLEKLGERSILLDADVIQADGGTRTAAITGCMVALWDAVQQLMKEGKIKENPIRGLIAAVSVGRVNGESMLDLCYEEDADAEVDLNVVMTQTGEFVEIQGTAEQTPFSSDVLMQFLKLAQKGTLELITEITHAINAR